MFNQALSPDGVLGHHKVTGWSFSVPYHCCLWLAQLEIFKLIQPISDTFDQLYQTWMLFN